MSVRWRDDDGWGGRLRAFLNTREPLQRHGLSVAEFTRAVWLPWNGIGAVLGLAAAAVLLTWAAFHALLMSSDERAMFRRMVGR